MIHALDVLEHVLEFVRDQLCRLDDRPQPDGHVDEAVLEAPHDGIRPAAGPVAGVVQVNRQRDAKTRDLPQARALFAKSPRVEQHAVDDADQRGIHVDVFRNRGQGPLLTICVACGGRQNARERERRTSGDCEHRADTDGAIARRPSSSVRRE